MARLALLVVCALSLGGCGLPVAVQAISLMIDGASLAATGKMPSDHIISAAADKDCALFRSLAGKPVCREEQEAKAPDVDVAARNSGDL